MKQHPELVLDLTRLTGHARKVIAHNVHKNLQKLGYHFEGETDGRPKLIDGTHIHINVPQASSRLNIQVDYNTATFTNANITVVLDATTQCDDFLATAKEMLTIVHDVGGIKVTITPTNIDVNPTELLAEVTEVTKVAKVIQQNEFGKRS